MSDSITLPRSGIVLTKTPYCHDGHKAFTFDNGRILLILAGNRVVQCIAFSGELANVEEKDRALAWLDSRVLALRAALMPADARDRVARALHDSLPCACGDRVLHSQAWFPIADAVLAAIGAK